MIFIGIDVGTTAAKAIAVDEAGRIYGRGYSEYALETPRPEWVTQNAEDWWMASAAAVRKAIAEIPDKNDIVAIGLSAQGATMTAIDANGNPIYPAITWMDNRARIEADELAQVFGGREIYRKSGWKLSPTLDAAKIAWLRRNEPDVFKTAAYFVSTIDFMNTRLTGRCVIDPTNAAIRQLTDIQMGWWNEEVLSFLELDEKRLPILTPSGNPVGSLTAAAAEILGLPKSTIVYSGAHDQYCAAIGSGAHLPGQVLLATGTTWVMLGVTEQPLYTDSYIASGVYPLSGRYGAMASMMSAGSALKWWSSIIGESYSKIDRLASSRRESAASLLCYPYVAGAGILHGDEKARLTGITISHDKYDIARALMEGVAFEARLLLEEFARNGMETKTLIMTGGASKSRLWSEITAHITGCEIIHMRETEAAALGAAVIAAVGSKQYDGLASAVSAMTQPLPQEFTDNGECIFYKEKFQRYIKESRDSHKT